MSSPPSAAQISDLRFFDFTGDQREEILLSTYAPGNCLKNEFPYHDSSSWIMVLDQELRFCFEPIEFEGRTSHTVAIPFRSGTTSYLAVVRGISIQGYHHLEGNIVSESGKIVKTRDLNPELNPFLKVFSLPEQNYSRLFCLSKNARQICELNENFDTLTQKELGSACHCGRYFLMDIDQDVNTEILAAIKNGNALAVIRNDLLVSGTLPISYNTDNPAFMIRERNHQPVSLAVLDGNEIFEYRYNRNPLFSLKFVTYLLVYLVLSHIIWGIQYLGRLQYQRQIAIKNKINELQTLVLQNQLDPHFILNALNSLNASMMLDRKEEANEKMKHFSSLIRTSLIDAGKMERSLQEELEFVTNYLEIERSRMEYPFDYHIDINKSVDISLPVPKMIIQIFCENSIKHGFRPLQKPGNLQIHFSTPPSSTGISIVITDDGAGLSYAASSPVPSTGMGISTFKQVTDLYNTIHKKQISWQIADRDPLQGTRVEILISY